MTNSAPDSPEKVIPDASTTGGSKGNDPETGTSRSIPDVVREEGRWSVAILAAILLGAAALYFSLYNPSRFGFYHDDSMYVTTARSLAEGQGYRIISLPYEPAATKYPPFYPFLLSLIWRSNSHFPENVNAMVALSGIATLIFLSMIWQYFTRQGYATRWQALLIVAMVAVNWRIVIYATGVYSEMIYAALSLVALFLAEELGKSRESRVLGLTLGLVLGVAFLTRSTGVTLLMAVAVYSLLRRKIRPVLLPLAVGGLFVLAWVAWCHVNRTSVEGVNVAWYTDYFGHAKEVLLQLSTHKGTNMAVTLLNIAGGNTLMLAVSIPLVCLGMDYTWVFYLGFALMFIAVGFIREVSRGWRLLHVYVICYLVLHVVWLPFVAYDRYLLPILPFLLLWLVREIASQALLVRGILVGEGSAIQKASAGLIGLAVLLIVSMTAYSYGSTFYLSLASASLEKEVKPAEDDAEAIEWIKANTDPADVLVCARDPMYFLYTGRKATRSIAVTAGIFWQDDLRRVLDVVDESNGKYLVLTPGDFDYQPDLQLSGFKDLIKEHPEKFALLFTSRNGRSTIYQTRAETK
ncbi:MAG: hypothetical protein WAU45_21275 [Blastocatellia bacterium]